LISIHGKEFYKWGGEVEAVSVAVEGVSVEGEVGVLAEDQEASAAVAAVPVVSAAVAEVQGVPTEV